MSTAAQKRLLRDFKLISSDPPEGISAAPVDNDIFRWNAVIFGPDNTPLEGGIWKVEIVFPFDYPEKPPVVKFKTEVFHPNVFADGHICLDILRSAWSPSFDLSSLLVAIQSLLAEPDLHQTPEGAANGEV